jgi:nicotinate-nucleotide pyrophosphorylase (carboxylating)
MALHDRVLIKDNHRRFWKQDETPTLDAAVELARRAHPGIPIEVEVETEAELESALRASPDWVLLDNMSPDQLRTCVARAKGKARTEASGGITLESAAAVAATGVDAISLGCLTHSAPSADLSLELA